MKKTRRTLKVAGQIRSTLSEIFRRDMSEPDFQSLTVTEVEVAPDMRFARVWVAVGDNEEERENARDLLDRSKGRLRMLLAQKLNMRHTPELAFKIDESTNRAMRIEDILREVLPHSASEDEDEDGSS